MSLELVECRACGAAFHVINSSHTRRHAIPDQRAYREKFGLPGVRLCSDKLSQQRKAVAARRAVAVEELALSGFYTSGRAAKEANIPLKTIMEALRTDRLPHGLATIITITAEGVKDSAGPITRIIAAKDLQAYAQAHWRAYQTRRKP